MATLCELLPALKDGKEIVHVSDVKKENFAGRRVFLDDDGILCVRIGADSSEELVVTEGMLDSGWLIVEEPKEGEELNALIQDMRNKMAQIETKIRKVLDSGCFAESKLNK